MFNYLVGFGSIFSSRQRSRFALVVLLLMSGWWGDLTPAREPDFEMVGTQVAPGGTWDVLPDGRIIAISSDDILIEISPQSGDYEVAGMLPGGLMAPWGASFLAVSPDGTRLMIGDNNFDGGLVYLVQTADLTGGVVAPRSFLQENFDAEWRDNRSIAISYGNPATFLGEVAILDVDADISIPILTIGGASGGVAFDEMGNLLAANGFDFVGGGSETGDVRAFAANEIDAVLKGQAGVIDFDTAGVLVVNALSGSPLNFGGDENLFIGGGRADEGDFFALAAAGAVADAVAGFGVVGDDALFAADPVVEGGSIYRGQFNRMTNEWVVDGADGFLYRYGMVHCLDLTVDQMVAGEDSTFMIREGTPGKRVGLVYGWSRGTTGVADDPQICVNFGIRGITRKRLLGAGDLRFDAEGRAEVVVPIPLRAEGLRLYLQAAAAGTCPEECASKVLAVRVE